MRATYPTIHALEAGLGDTERLKAGLCEAEARNAGWVTLLGRGERLLGARPRPSESGPSEGGSGPARSQTALDLAMPAFSLFDAIFGGLAVGGALWRPSRLAFDEPWRLPHALLHWWVGPPRFIRTQALRRLLDAAPPSEGAIDRIFRLWSEARCIKLAAPLADASQEPRPLSDDDRARVLERLAADPVFVPVPYGERTFRLPYTGCNAGIEREQTRGLFFEAAELEFLKARVGAEAEIVDVGANTGNHTVFFAGPMRAARVLPFEPLPDAGLALGRAVDANRLARVDLSMLGCGIGAAPSRMRVERSVQGGLGATRLVPDPAGAIEVLRLDDVLTSAPGFLKIDVEGMEMDVLDGASATIRNARPLIFIEIANANTRRFLDWLELAKYRIERIFSDKGHANYLIAPEI